MRQPPNEAAMERHATQLSVMLKKVYELPGVSEQTRNCAASAALALHDSAGRAVPQEHIERRVELVLEALSDLAAIRKLEERDQVKGALERMLASFDSGSSASVFRLRLKLQTGLQGYCNARGSGVWRVPSSATIPKAVAGG